MSNYVGLAAVTSVASVACHRTLVHYARVLSALHSRGSTARTIAWARLNVSRRHVHAYLALMTVDVPTPLSPLKPWPTVPLVFNST